MTSIKCQFYLVAEGVEKTTTVVIKRVRLFSDDTWFIFPEDLQKLSHHKSLLELSPLKSALAVLKNRGQFRNVNATLPAEIVKLYLDDDGNFVFRDYLLSEARSVPAPSSEPGSGELVACLNKVVGSREETVKDILKHFLLEKFSAKNRNAESWCELFEKESARFSLSGQKQIEVFKSCLDSSMSDWFAMNQRKLGILADWKIWKADLISTFGDTSWKPIRYAFNFKFINGSYIDYAVKKEKILLDLDRSLPELVILDLIVIGLPIHIQNSLNRNVVNSVKILHNKLKKFESEDKVDGKVKSQNFSFFSSSKVNNDNVNNNKKGKVFNNSASEKKNFSERKPCNICFKKGFPNRFHSENNCWYKDKEPYVPKLVNNLELESPVTSEDEQKN